MSHLSLSKFADKVNMILPVFIKEFTKRHANELSKGKITMPQFLIMSLLDKQGPSAMTQLAKFINVTTAAMTGIADKLVKYGYIVRSPDSKDRRIINIKLTAKGSALVKKINNQRRAMITDIFGTVSQHDRAHYLKILTHIHAVLTKEKSDEA